MSTQLTTLLDAVTATGPGASLDLSVDPRYQGGAHSFVVSGTFTGTVVIEGSVDGTTWYSLGTFTDGGGLLERDGVYALLRGNVTALTSGSITLKVRYGRLQDLKADLDTLLGRLTQTRAGYLDNLVRLDTAVSSVSAKANIDNLIKQIRAQTSI